MLDSNVSTYIDKDGNVQEVGSGGSEYANTSEIVDNAITLTSTSTLTDLATQILAQKTKVCRVSYGESTMDTLARLYELFNISKAYGTPPYTCEYFFKVLSSDDYIELECSAAGYAAFFRGGIIQYERGDSEHPYGKWKAIPLIPYANPYSVGSIYQSTSSTSPSSLLGGTWTALPNVGVDESSSLVMTSGNMVSFSFTEGSGTVSSIDMVLRHNEDYSIIQINGRMRVTPTSNVGGRVTVAYGIGSNVIKEQFTTQCGFYVTNDGTRESIVAKVYTNGLIEFFNNATVLNIPSSQTVWVVNFTLFNKSSDGETLYRWKRIS